MQRLELTIVLAILLLGGCAQQDPETAFAAGDYERSLQLWQMRLQDGEADDPDVYNYLGIHYSLGLGVGRDLMKAYKYYKRGAEQGHADAQRNLADMYRNGRGVPKDNILAFQWYFAASRQGNKHALQYMDVLSRGGNLTPNQQIHAKIAANPYIKDKKQRFSTPIEYIRK